AEGRAADRELEPAALAQRAHPGAAVRVDLVARGLRRQLVREAAGGQVRAQSRMQCAMRVVEERPVQGLGDRVHVSDLRSRAWSWPRTRDTRGRSPRSA